MFITVLATNLIGRDRDVGGGTTEIATTLMARDYKGPGHQTFNVVVEIEKWELELPTSLEQRAETMPDGYITKRD